MNCSRVMVWSVEVSQVRLHVHGAVRTGKTKPIKSRLNSQKGLGLNWGNNSYFSQGCQYRKKILNQSQKNFCLKNVHLITKNVFAVKISLHTSLQAEIQGGGGPKKPPPSLFLG